MKFIYFDLGNVLLFFSHDRACKNIAELTGTPSKEVRQQLFDSGLAWQYEDGTLGHGEFHRAYCLATKTTCNQQDFIHAYSDIFWPNEPMVDMIKTLKSQQWPLGILSNTSPGHWELVTDGRYPILSTKWFDVFGLSYELRSMKPAPEIYQRAADLAGVRPGDIFFTDDRADNIAAALDAGYDAVQFIDYHQLWTELQLRSS